MSERMKRIMQIAPVIPVLVIDRLDDAIPLASAIFEGGLKVLEITMRTPVALSAVAQVKQALPDAIVGTGSVINETMLSASKDVGADFVVSPGFTDSLVSRAKQEDIALLPGASTASEVMQVLELGLDCMKFFPAKAAGGPAMLKSFAGPLPQVSFCPTGGITEQNAVDYLSLPNVLCVGGTWLASKELCERKNWNQAKLLSEKASRLTGCEN